MCVNRVNGIREAVLGRSANTSPCETALVRRPIPVSREPSEVKGIPKTSNDPGNRRKGLVAVHGTDASPFEVCFGPEMIHIHISMSYPPE